MKRLTAAVALLAASTCPPLLAAPAAARPPARPATPVSAPAAAGNVELGQRLRALGLEPKVDADGDYRLLFGLEGGRQQVTYVRARTERFGELEIREIWSPAYQASGDTLPGEIANRLLQDGQENILGAWVRQDGTAIYVTRVPADLAGRALSDAIEATTRAADAMEAQLTPGQDQF
ncbi:MAG TPA: hypothetical protein VD865_04660 [Stenotrophomonas sp.]|nr:hypothetical protein [Stenotrophomonas sp.]